MKRSGGAWDVRGLKSEPLLDISKHDLFAGVSFYALVSSVSSQSLTFDVLTGRDVADYGVDTSNRHRHLQTLRSMSPGFAVLLDSGDDKSLPGAMPEDADATAVTVEEFSALTRTNPRYFLKDACYVVHVARGGVVDTIARVPDPG